MIKDRGDDLPPTMNRNRDSLSFGIFVNGVTSLLAGEKESPSFNYGDDFSGPWELRHCDYATTSIEEKLTGLRFGTRSPSARRSSI